MVSELGERPGPGPGVAPAPSPLGSTPLIWTLGPVIGTLLTGTTIIVLVMAIPIQRWFFGKDPTLLTAEGAICIPIAFYALDGFLRVFKSPVCFWPAFAFLGVIGWSFLGIPFVPPPSLRDLNTPTLLLLVTFGGISLFSRYWRYIETCFPWILYCLAGVFLYWFLVAYFGRQFFVELKWNQELGLSRYIVGEVLPTELAIILGFQLCFALYLLMAQRGIWPVNMTIALGSVALVFFVAGSRVAYVGVVIVVFFFLLSRQKKRYPRLLLITILVLSVAGGTLTPYLRFIGQQAEAHLTGLSDEDKAREAIYKYTYQGFTQNPLFGMGHGNFSITLSQPGGAQVFYNPHQNFLGVACSFGFPAVLFYFAFVLLTFRALWVRGDYFKTNKLLSGANYFITACLWFVFLVQFRGLFHYTWIAKDLAFMTGAGLGVRLFLESHRQHIHVQGLKSRLDHSYLPSSPAAQLHPPFQKA